MAYSNFIHAKTTVGAVVLVGIGAIIGAGFNKNLMQVTGGVVGEVSVDEPPLIELGSLTNVSLRLTQSDSAPQLGLKTAQVQSAPAPEPLRLPGSLMIDPNKLSHVHSRFSGEVVSLGEVTDEDGSTRRLQYGDHVQKGQLLAVIWSQGVGEKKSELIDALSRLESSQSLRKRLESVSPGVVADRVVVEAKRDVEADLIAVAKAERTLISWRIPIEEIEILRREVKSIREQKVKGEIESERKWAETEVRSPLDGVIVEKNFNVGDIIEAQEDIFKIADLSRLQVAVSVYEEDLGLVRSLKPQDRKWNIDLKSDRSDNRIPGTFHLIGNVIDPAQRTGVIMGWLDNPGSKLAVGQFVTATIQLPKNPKIVAVPESAVIEEGNNSVVYVEVDANRREFARRIVKVVRRAAGVIYVDSAPDGDVANPLRVGERVVTAGTLAMEGELANLLATTPKAKIE